MPSYRAMFESVQKLRWNLYELKTGLNLSDDLVSRLEGDLQTLFFAIDKKLCDFLNRKDDNNDR